MSSAFMTPYNEDSQRLTNSQREEFNYYVQPGNAGPAELFAELFALTQSRAGEIEQRSQGLAKAFPQSYKFMHDLVSSY
jgi:hypothetical protein